MLPSFPTPTDCTQGLHEWTTHLPCFFFYLCFVKVVHPHVGWSLIWGMLTALASFTLGFYSCTWPLLNYASSFLSLLQSIRVCWPSIVGQYLLIFVIPAAEVPLEWVLCFFLYFSHNARLWKTQTLAQNLSACHHYCSFCNFETLLWYTTAIFKYLYNRCINLKGYTILS